MGIRQADARMMLDNGIIARRSEKGDLKQFVGMWNALASIDPVDRTPQRLRAAEALVQFIENQVKLAKVRAACACIPCAVRVHMRAHACAYVIILVRMCFCVDVPCFASCAAYTIMIVTDVLLSHSDES